MRKKQRLQTSIFDYSAEHVIGTELKNFSMMLASTTILSAL